MMKDLAGLGHLFVVTFLFHFASFMVIPPVTDVTMDAVCPGRDECSVAIYLSGFQNAVTGLGALVVTPIVGNLSDRYGRKALMTLPVTVAIAPLFILACSRSEVYFYVYYVAKIIAGVFCEGTTHCLCLAFVADHVGPRRGGVSHAGGVSCADEACDPLLQDSSCSSSASSSDEELSPRLPPHKTDSSSSLKRAPIRILGKKYNCSPAQQSPQPVSQNPIPFRRPPFPRPPSPSRIATPPTVASHATNLGGRGAARRRRDGRHLSVWRGSCWRPPSPTATPTAPSPAGCGCGRGSCWGQSKSGLPSLSDMAALLTGSLALSGAAIVTFFYSLCEHGLQTALLYYLKAQFGYSKNEYANLLLIAGAAGMLSQLTVMPILAPILGEEMLLIVGLLGGCTHVFLYGIAWSYWVPYFAASFVILSAFVYPSIRTRVSKSVGSNEQGIAQGCIAGISSFASILGPIIFTPLTAWFLSETEPFNFKGFSILCAGFCTLIAFIISLRMRGANLVGARRPQFSMSKHDRI